MNKLIRRLAMAFVCISMAVGVGVTVASNREVLPVSATQGDELAVLSGTGSGYATRKTTTDSHNVGWVLRTGQSGYLGVNNASNHSSVKPTADDLPVVKAVDASATTNSTGIYYYFTTTAVSNVGALTFHTTAHNNANNAAPLGYVVYSSTAASSGSATWELVPLSGSSTSTQGSSISGTSTYTFTFASTQTSAKYYGFVSTLSAYDRWTAGTIKLLEGATGGHTVTTEVSGLNLSIGNIGDSGTVTLTTTTPKKKATNVSATNCTYSLSGNVLSLSSVTGNVVISATIIDADVTEISVSGQTTKFSVGDEYEFDGEVTATYDDWRAEHTSEVIDSGFTVDDSDYDKDNAGTYEITVSHNGGVADPVSFNVQVLATEDYGLYSSDLVEGYYLVTAYDSDTAAMNHTISSNRAQYEVVSPSNNKIKTGDSSIVWQFVKNGDYWNIKSTDSDISSTPFIASNGANNYAQMVASGDADAAKWTIEHSDSDFTIKNLAQSSRYLKRNGSYGFACYGTSGTIQLYKLLELEVGITTEADKDNVLIGSTHAITLNEVRNNYKGSSHVAFTTSDTAKINLTDNGDGTASVYGKATGSATVTATLEGKTGSITLTVVRTLTGIEVTTAPTTTTYTEGETFDPAGMVVTASFDGASSSTIAAGNYSYTPSGALGTSDNEITVSYTENGITKTDTVSITVNEVQKTIDHIVWTAPATKYYDNDSLTSANITALAVKAYWEGEDDPTDIALGTYTLTLGSDEITAEDLPYALSKSDNGKALKVSYKGEELSVSIEVIETLNAINGEGESANVTFAASTVSGTSPLSVDPITMTCSNGTLNNGSEYRLFKNSTTTFTGSNLYVTKIEFTGVSGNPVSNFGDVDGLTTDGDNGVWEGKATSVSFVASTAQVRCTSIKVTYVPLTNIANSNFDVQKQLLLFVSYFNTELDKVCNDNGSDGISTTWTDLASKYTAYRTASGNTTVFDNLIKNADATERAGDGSASTGDSLQNALARYDWIVAHHTDLTDFINTTSGRDAVQASAPVVPFVNAINGANGSTIIVIISLVSLTAVCGYFVIRRRKENN